MTKCVECGENFEITEDGREFYAKMGVQEPRLCPVDRSRRRLAFRHGRKLYKRKCDLTGEPIVSQFDANVSFPVYRASEWHSDKWEAMDYRVDFDFDKGFF
ncbi:hypothetical protein KJ855_03750, partial [Patescibacteria group bacterium]|nr:hypothetical protein [Patescibacteria group bacterium]